MFGKTAKFPFLWNDLRSTFFQFLSSFPFVMVFPFDTGTVIISPQNRDIFLMFQGTLDLITGENSKRLRKRTTAVFAASFANLAFGHAQGAPGHRPQAFYVLV